MTLSLEQYQKLRDLIYQKLGLFFEDKKIYFLEKRLQKRLAAKGCGNFDEYYFILKFSDPRGLEMQELANLITTNETYMFREFEQLASFADECLPEVLRRKEAVGDRKLRIWSAGCSSGEEPYTLAIILAEVLQRPAAWDVQILATDIDQNILEMARKARYSLRSVKPVPPEYFDRHIEKIGDEYQVRPATRKLVEIRHLNLSDHGAMRAMGGFDFIFCRNVLIYFDDVSRRTTVDHFYRALERGGFIFLGHSESVARITNAFKLRRMADFLVYCKE